ncbi:MAG: hypothetical protein WC985_03080 [Thermoplasmata archaeon]
MANSERCPICEVPVKAENLSRHLDANHPRDPRAKEIREEIRDDARYAPRAAGHMGLRLRKAHVAVIATVAFLVVGAYAAAPYFDPYRNFSADSCIVESQPLPIHIHPYLSIFIDGVRSPVPYNIGVSPTCVKAVHTHDTGYDPATQAAKIHVESPIVRDFTLSDFFRVWGRTLTPTQVLGCAADGTRVVTMTVDGFPSTAFGSLLLRDGAQIQLSCAPAA